MKFPVAIQLYSVRDAVAEDMYGTLKALKEIGYDGVEFAGLFDHSPEEIKEMCAELGLVPISAHVPYADMVKDPEEVLRDYAKIGCRYVAVPYLVEEDRPGTPGFAAVIENVKKIGAAAQTLGMQLLYHNHDFEFLKIDGKYALDILYDSVSPEHLATELDTCWVNVGGENPADYIIKYTGRAPVVHLKDFEGEKSANMYALIGIDSEGDSKPSTFEFRPVGSGKQTFPAILEAAEKAGSSWVVVEQDEPSMGLSPMECAAKSRAYLKTIGC